MLLTAPACSQLELVQLVYDDGRYDVTSFSKAFTGSCHLKIMKLLQSKQLLHGGRLWVDLSCGFPVFGRRVSFSESFKVVAGVGHLS